MDEAINVLELPLFPLNTVLFPGQVLPLHVFEERYRLMIRRCLAEDQPFGVVLIKHGGEVGAGAEPYSIGTFARIIESTHLADGAMNIITVGVERFRIRRLLRDRPYLCGEVETLRMEEPHDAPMVALLAERVRAQVAHYIQLIAEAAGLQIRIDQMPDTPQQVGYLAAIAMQIDNREKQELLAATSLNTILAGDIHLLNRETVLLNWMIAHREWPANEQFGHSEMLLPN